SDEIHFRDAALRRYREYESIREDSILGRIFEIANSIHDEIDAFVCIGKYDSLVASRALVYACWDPFHNELDRGQRGSKPRVYFLSPPVDNDYFCSLVSRLTLHAFGRSECERRWMLMPILEDPRVDSHCEFPDWQTQQVIAAGQWLLGKIPTSLRSRYCVPMIGTRTRSSTRAWIDSFSPRECFQWEPALEGPANLFDAPGLMAGAMMGLDVVQMAGGAHEVNQHLDASAIAVQIAELIRRDGFPKIQTTVQALGAFVEWAECWNRCRFGIVPTADWNLRLHVAAPRTDAIESLASLSPRDLQDSGREHEERCHDSTRQDVILEIPPIDTNGLGRLFQTWMIATTLAVDETR
ncbi:MAG: hypothetical protein AAFN70_12245, partial [Planctomycetota bacterium]